MAQHADVGTEGGPREGAKGDNRDTLKYLRCANSHTKQRGNR